jgi:two-component system sensor histidine kinase/response regulator
VADINYRVLVVDDIEKNLQLIGNLLQDKGVNILLANNGTKALSAAQKKIPDLILLDIAMPEMDGYEVCKRLKENEATSKIPIIFLTAKNETEDIVKGFAYGAVDYITKPFNKDELISRVFTHLELKKSRDIISEQNHRLTAQNVRILEHTQQVEQLNQKLNKQNQELKEANATKDKFFSIVSHDLRSPFSSIISFTDLLIQSIDEFNKEKLQDFAIHLKESTENTYKLLENLLNWARAQRGKLTFNPEKIDLYTLVNENIKLLDTIAKEKNLYLSASNFEEVYVIADADMINTVIRNLFSNAIKFTKQGGAIQAKCEYLPEDDLIAVSISDNGIGMDDETLNKLFDLSEHHTTRGTNNEPGTGLGLILCKEFIELNSGTIQVKSEQGKGSSFTFTLPLYKQ